MTKKKLTLKNLIENKEKFDRKGRGKKTQELYLDELDATIVIEEPDTALVTEVQELGKDEDYEGNGDELLFYNVVVEPNLKDPELQKEYGCVEPIDIVNQLFSPGTIYNVGVQAMKLGGFTDGATPVDKVKN